jgi:hypothetical protein
MSKVKESPIIRAGKAFAVFHRDIQTIGLAFKEAAARRFVG